MLIVGKLHQEGEVVPVSQDRDCGNKMAKW